MQRKTHKHRLLPATLSLAMVLTMVPAHAAAAGQQPPVPETTVNSDLFSHAFKLDFGYQSSSWLERITGLWVDGMPYEKVSSTIYLKTGTYVVQPSDGRIVLPPSLTRAVKCVVRADGYEDLDLTVDTGRYTVAVNPPAPTGTLPTAGTTADVRASLEKVMSVYLKLTITGADGYVGGITGIRRTSTDGIGADLTAVTYKPSLSGPAYYLDADGSAVYFDAMDPALRDGDTLRITNGQYKDLLLKITRTDGGYQAQVVSEEPTQPQPKPVSDKLADRLTVANSVQEANGSYRFEQASQAIREFGGANETVTVPAQIKTWLGAATGSPRGSLGYALAESGEPVQTILIPAGCDLTLTNLDLLSSVKVVVQNGGKLTLRDSVVQGVVEVEQGGTFSMNYDSTSSKFLTGAAINGQLRLKSGAVLENAAVSSDSSRDAKNIQPVVAVLGNATVKGYVFLKGDQAQTGTTYAGRTGLLVSGSTLTLSQGALLAVYGGGMGNAATVGGDAIRLDRGTISGAGTLIAVGGDGTYDRGGDAVSGSGTVIPGTAYLQGGASAFPVTLTGTAGKAVATGVYAPNAVKNDGTIYRNERENPRIPRWTTAAPGYTDVRQIISYVTARTTPARPSQPGSNLPGDKRPGSNLPQPGKNGTYNVRVFSSSHGSVEVSNSRANKGDSLHLTVKPEKGYVLDTITVTDQNNKTVKLTEKSDLRYTFDMPGSPVSVQATFVKESSGRYSVRVTSSSHGSVEVSDSRADKGDTLRLTVKPEKGYVLDTITVTDQNNKAVKLTQKSDLKYTFEMPASQVSIQATFVKESSGRYSVRVASASHGSVEVNDSRADKGDTLRLTVKPEKGYVLDTLTVTDQNNKAVKLTQKSDLKYTFEMPASQVSIQATFIKESAARKPDQPVTHVVPSTPLVPATPVTPTTPVTPVTPAAVPFKDVSSKDYFYAAVQWAVGKNVTQGTSANTFSPDAQCTRAQVVTFLWRAAGSPAPKNRTLPFRDVRPGDYCYDAVCWAVEQGITGGTGNGAFSPDLVVTRAQAVALLHRAAGSPAARTTSAFSDVASGSYYAAAAQWASAQGITQGTGGNRFSPDKDCTRGQIVSLLYRGVQQNAFSW